MKHLILLITLGIVVIIYSLFTTNIYDRRCSVDIQKAINSGGITLD